MYVYINIACGYRSRLPRLCVTPICAFHAKLQVNILDTRQLSEYISQINFSKIKSINLTGKKKIDKKK